MGEWKLVWSENPDKCWFFHLARDPYEAHNLLSASLLLPSSTSNSTTDSHSSVVSNSNSISETITTTALLQWYHNNDTNSDSDSSDNDGESEMKIARKRLRVLLHELLVTDAQQVTPLWPKILETAIPIDKTAQHALHPTDDEYVYTVN